MFCYCLFNRETNQLLLKINYLHHVAITLSLNVDKVSSVCYSAFYNNNNSNNNNNNNNKNENGL